MIYIHPIKGQETTQCPQPLRHSSYTHLQTDTGAFPQLSLWSLYSSMFCRETSDMET